MELIKNIDGQPMTDSRLVAEKFGKRHSVVLRALRNIECSPEFSQHNFAQSDFIDERGKTRMVYNMTKDGFTFLVMGFTGKQAAIFKEEYINEFNRMASALNNSALSTIREVEYLTLKIEEVTRNLSAAGSFLSIGGKQTKPALVSVLNDRLEKLQPLLTGFDDEIKNLRGE